MAAPRNLAHMCAKKLKLNSFVRRIKGYLLAPNFIALVFFSAELINFATNKYTHANFLTALLLVTSQSV